VPPVVVADDGGGDHLPGSRGSRDRARRGVGAAASGARPRPTWRGGGNVVTGAARLLLASSSLRHKEAWDERRLRNELGVFLAGRERWPGFPEFQAAGKALLYAELRRRCRPRRWANLLGIPMCREDPAGPGQTRESRRTAGLSRRQAGMAALVHLRGARSEHQSGEPCEAQAADDLTAA
jgi:hypothetical protein